MSEKNKSNDKKFRLWAEQTVKDVVKYATSNVGPGLNKISEITTNIYCSDQAVASDVAILKEHRINIVLIVGDTEVPNELLEAYDKKKIKYIQIPLKDDPRQQLGPALMQSYELIGTVLAAKHRMLVHCTNGISMAPAVIIGYLLRRTYTVSFSKYCKMLENAWRSEEAAAEKIKKVKEALHSLEDLTVMTETKLRKIIEFIKQARSCINPNPGFIWQLLMYEQQIKEELSESASDIIERETKNLKAFKKKHHIADLSDSVGDESPEENSETGDSSSEGSDNENISDLVAIDKPKKETKVLPKTSQGKKAVKTTKETKAVKESKNTKKEVKEIVSKSRVANTGVKVQQKYHGVDTIEDLQRLEVSDNESTPLESAPDVIPVIVATGDDESSESGKDDSDGSEVKDVAKKEDVNVKKEDVGEEDLDGALDDLNGLDDDLDF